MDKALRVMNVSKHYPGFNLSNVSFELERGYVMGLIGPNGAGKSTLIKLIMNLVKRDGGTIEVFGLDNQEHELEIKERIGFVYDTIPYYGMLTVSEMKSLIAPFYQKWNENVFRRYLKEFGLNPGQKIDTLSRGMQTKFQLAVALSHEAEFIIMDEPTSGLDPVFRSELLDILYDIIQDEEKTILFSTHITTDLEKIADYITFINDGQLVFCMPKDEVLDRYAVVKGGLELLGSGLERRFVGMRRGHTGFAALTDDAEALMREYGQKLVVEKASLEDIMVYMVRGERSV
ncbi:MAG: ABC transporter ATP-binding protein [Firmicutes bacterium]|jgi:ABC-2 type transport system ATP-binding protein|nr:ABC transporter ATP-binding protein [Bacillota bacterium]